MSPRLLSAFIAATLFCGGSAHAADRWVTVATMAGGGTVQIDATSLYRHGDEVQTWVRYNYASDQPLPVGATQSDGTPYSPYVTGAQYYRTDVAFTYFRCGPRTYAVSEEIFYAAGHPSGPLANSDVAPALMAFTPVVPDSVSEVALAAACAWHSRRS